MSGPKVQIETTGAFGQPAVQQLELDTNRVNIHRETISRYCNAVAIPSRGIYTDGLMWILATATPFRLLDSLAWMGLFSDVIFLSLIALIILPLAILTYQTFVQVAKVRGAIAYRVFLVLLGFAIATVNIWY